MEVPPFHWPKPALAALSVRRSGAARRNSCGSGVCGEMSGEHKGRRHSRGSPSKRGHEAASAVALSVMLYVGKTPKWGAFTRLETRTKESNRRAREKKTTRNESLLSY